MRKAAAIIFFFVYIIPVIKPYLPLLNYSLNKGEIISRFCENKSKPMLHCEGRCHLKKELKKASKEDVKVPQIFKTTLEQIPTSVQECNLSNVLSSVLNDVLVSNYIEIKGSAYSPKVFEPPRYS